MGAEGRSIGEVAVSFKFNDERRQFMKEQGFHVCMIRVDSKTRQVVEVRYVHGGSHDELGERGWPHTLRVCNDRGESIG